MTTLTLIGDAIFFVLGYVASIFTWSWVRTQITGVSAEIAKLRAKADALETTIKGK